MLRLWNRKGTAVKKWRSRAWSINPRVTTLTIIKEAKLDRIDATDFNFDFPQLLEKYPQFFEVLTDIEQFT
jgi:hypothetical protein